MSRPEGDSATFPPPASSAYTRQWLLIFAVALAALPAPVLHLLDFTGGPYPDLPSAAEAVIFGLGVFAAATLLTWASEVAETEIPAALALVVLALIAVMPEYAVDLYFAWTAPSNPEHGHLAIANMTGGNRLLVGLAWPVIFLIFYLRTKITQMPVERSNALGILFLGAATIYSFSIPLRGNLSLIDTGVMFTLFAAYLYLSFRSAPEPERLFVGPAAAIAALGKNQRRGVVLLIFIYAAVVIFAAAEPFATGLVDTGKSAGIDEFVLVQWVAPLASESPEFILAGLLAMRGRHNSAMTILISSKVNQWTLLIGSLPLAYSISGGTLHPLEFDARQSEEVFLTAGQSLFAVAILFSLSLARWEAAVLGLLFLTQFFSTDTSVRLGYAGVYTTLGVLTILRDTPSAMPDFLRAARDTALGPKDTLVTDADRARGPP
jgi:cation:H+ antiporter